MSAVSDYRLPLPHVLLLVFLLSQVGNANIYFHLKKPGYAISVFISMKWTNDFQKGNLTQRDNLPWWPIELFYLLWANERNYCKEFSLFHSILIARLICFTRFHFFQKISRHKKFPSLKMGREPYRYISFLWNRYTA